ncbi:MAG: hypothetical protein HYX78_01990 [Armatimonadetes bacterium]|nr:hypothetical protein [Armatimonadota bacterium]
MKTVQGIAKTVKGVLANMRYSRVVGVRQGYPRFGCVAASGEHIWLTAEGNDGKGFGFSKC